MKNKILLGLMATFLLASAPVFASGLGDDDPLTAVLKTISTTTKNPTDVIKKLQAELKNEKTNFRALEIAKAKDTGRTLQMLLNPTFGLKPEMFPNVIGAASIIQTSFILDLGYTDLDFSDLDTEQKGLSTLIKNVFATSKGFIVAPDHIEEALRIHSIIVEGKNGDGTSKIGEVTTLYKETVQALKDNLGLVESDTHTYDVVKATYAAALKQVSDKGKAEGKKEADESALASLGLGGGKSNFSSNSGGKVHTCLKRIYRIYGRYV